MATEEDTSQRAREENAAKEAGDPDRLLPGEDPDDVHPDSARLWVDVYAELLDYKRELLRVTDERLATMADEPARREVVETDNVVIEAECRRFERRLAFWTDRLRP
jgi:hypothetical protein